MLLCSIGAACVRRVAKIFRICYCMAQLLGRFGTSFSVFLASNGLCHVGCQIFYPAGVIVAEVSRLGRFGI
jgi:hypothetical protein